MADLALFGDALRQYSGTGQLYDANIPYPCDFEIAQFRDGEIRIKCAFPYGSSTPQSEDLGKDGAICLQGKLDDGRLLTIYGPLLSLRSQVFISSTKPSFQHLIYLCDFQGRLIVGNPKWQGEAEVRFALVNFEFWRTEIRDGSNVLSLVLDGKEITIWQVPNYAETMKILKARGGIEQTCEVRIRVTSPNEVEASVNLMQILCNLLSLARGTLISSLYFDVLSTDGDTLYSEHRPAFTQSYMSALPLIDPKHTGSYDTRNFLESAYKHYLELDSLYSFNRVVHAYIEIRSVPVLEVRGLVLASFAEYLAGKHAEKHDFQTYMPTQDFDEHLKELEKGVKKAIRNVFPELENDRVEAMKAKCKGFNYRSFKSKLKRIRDDSGISRALISDSEIQDFVDTRNTLVHYMSYETDRMTFNTKEPWGKFLGMLHVVDKLLLGMLEYRGYYMDTTTFERKLFLDSDIQG